LRLITGSTDTAYSTQPCPCASLFLDPSPRASPGEHRRAAETGLTHRHVGQPAEQQPMSARGPSRCTPSDLAEAFLLPRAGLSQSPALPLHPLSHPAQLAHHCLRTRNPFSKCEGGTKDNLSLQLHPLPLLSHTHPLTCYVRGCTDAASPGASLDAHPHTPGCTELSGAFPSVYTKQAIVKRKIRRFSSGHRNLHSYHTRTQNLLLCMKLLALQSPSEALSGCCSKLEGWWEGREPGMMSLFASQFPKSTWAVAKLTWMAGGAGCLFSVPGGICLGESWCSSQPREERRIWIQPWQNAHKLPCFTDFSGSFLDASTSAGTNMPWET